MSTLSLSETLLSAIRYEHWLRYHFAVLPEAAESETADETEGGAWSMAILSVPEDHCSHSEKEEPHLYPLLKSMQGQCVSMDNTRACIFAHLAALEGVSPQDEAFGQRLISMLDDPDFRRDLDAFHTWVQETAEEEEKALKLAAKNGTMPAESPAPFFAAWEQEFRTWAKANIRPHVSTISPYKPE